MSCEALDIWAVVPVKEMGAAKSQVWLNQTAAISPLPSSTCFAR